MRTWRRCSPSSGTLSTLEQYREQPANAAQIDRRARADAELMGELLRSYGYFDAMVRSAVDAAGAERLRGDVERRAGPGLPLHRGDACRGSTRRPAADAAALREAFTVRADEPIDAAGSGEAAGGAAGGARGARLCLRRGRRRSSSTIDHETRTATLALPVRPAGTRRFGGFIVEGRPLFSARPSGDDRALRAKANPSAPTRIEDLRQALVATGLVSTVTIRPVAREGTDLVDLAIGIEPAPMRTIAGEAGYGTGEGIRLEASWQHRNLLPPEGAVTFRGVAGTREQRSRRSCAATISAGGIRC